MSGLRLKRADEGFTLVELLIVTTILPLIVGAISAGFITTLQNRDTTVTRLTESHDAQITSAYFVRDVKSAQYVSTSNTSLCGTTSYLLGLSWSLPTNDPSKVVTDYAVYTTNPTNGTLIRTFCASGNNTVVLAHDAFPTTPPVAITGNCPQGGKIGANAATCAVDGGTAYAAVTTDCTDGSFTCANSKPIVSTPQKGNPVGVNNITLDVVEHATGFDYHLTASPEGWTAAGANQPGGGSAGTPPLDLLGNNSNIQFTGNHCPLSVNGVIAIANPSSDGGGIIQGSSINFSYTQIDTPSSGLGGHPNVVVGPPLSDPYTSLTPPSPGPGVTTVTGSFPAGQLSGIYYVTGNVVISGNTNVTSGNNPVLVYIAAGGSISISGNGSLTLTTPINKYAPIVIWGAKGSGPLAFGGNGQGSTIGGTIYDPTGTVSLSGGGNGGGLSASNVIANTIQCNGGGSTNLGLNFGPVATATSLTADPSPAADGDAVTLAAAVTTPNNPATVNSGNVVFQVADKNHNVTTDCATPSSVNNGGVAKCVTGPLSASLAPYEVTAFYQGNTSFGPSVSDPFTEQVLEATTTTVATNAQNLVSGQTAVFTATVKAADNSTPTGSITFAIIGSDGSSVNCTSGNTKTLAAGTATCTSGALLHAGSQYAVTATYAGTASTWIGSTSNQLAVPVAIAQTTTAVVSSKPSSKPSQQVVFTATVSPSPGGGSVAWTITGTTGPAVACTSMTTLANGVATCTVAGGTLKSANAPYTVKATYSGTGNYATSNGQVTQSVASVGSTTAFTSLTHGNGARARTMYTDKVTVTGNDGGSPTGSVFFYLCSGTTTGCTSTTPGATQSVGGVGNNGVAASPPTASLTSGAKYCFGAVYQGDTDYLSSSDTTTDQCFTA